MARPSRPQPERPVEALTLGPAVKLGSTRVLVGTCSWTDATLIKETEWYPRRSMSAAERLAFYASRYPIAEADSTYYFPPSEQLTRSWAERTPEGFTMNVKAYSLLTGHPTRPNSLWADLRSAVLPGAQGKSNLYAAHLDPEALEEVWYRFVFALRPLQAAGRLGAVLMQYPTWFTAKRANREELVKVRQRLGGLRACVEFRSPTWLEAGELDRTAGVLADNRLALVVVDAPSVAKLPPLTAVTTPDLAVVRFHGRAESTWKARTTSAADRFRYLYRSAELAEWVPRLGALAERAGEVHALMNNCYQDFGVRNAADLRGLLAADAS